MQTRTKASGLSTRFRKISFPPDDFGYVPRDIDIEIPQTSEVSKGRLHLLAYIPWDKRYLERVPKAYRAFFSFVLPHLGARTTNVHTATCLSLLDGLIRASGLAVDGHVLRVALIMHDCGWSEIGEADIADSLDYSGLSHTRQEAEVAWAAKQKHDVLGSVLARKLMDEYGPDLALTPAQKDYVGVLVRNHTAPWDYQGPDNIPPELVLLSDADRLWSYTHENFWQDTIRKNVDPQVYAYNLAVAIPGYFLTEAARERARGLLLDREDEIAELYLQVNKAGGLVKGMIAA